MKINKFSLSFTPELEVKFQKDYFNSSIGLLRISFLLGAIYYASFAFLDTMVMPEVKQELYFIRFYVVIPVILLVVILSFTPTFRKCWQFAAILLSVISGIGIVIMTVITPEIGRQNYYPGIMLVLIYCYLLIRLRFVWASLSGWLIFIAYLLSTIIFPGVSRDIIITNIFFLGSVNILGMFGSYALEYYARSDFFSRYLLQKERYKVENANLKLEKKVSEKTEELQLDIQHRKKVEKKLRIAIDKAEESNRLKSAFLLNLSHEIRTPLNGIFGFTSLLQSHDLTGEQQKEFIDLIQKSGNRMLTTVTDLVEISRIETGQVNLSFKPVNIIDEVRSCCQSYADEAQGKGLNLIYENNFDDIEPSIITDREKFQIILSKIIGNAIKYTEIGKIVVNCSTDASQLICSIKDTGIGIPENRRNAVFERFIQADISDTRAFEGSGLGLSIAKAYVEMLDGKIWLESEEGAGTVFYFTIPYKDYTSEKIKGGSLKTAAIKKHHLENLNLLIAEDDQTSQLYLNELLNNKFKSIVFANNGKEAVEICASNQNIDVVLMDIKMPVMDGYEATRKIREFNKELVIIAQTAYALEGDREKVLAAGCNEHIAKPLKKETLLKVLEKYF